MRAAAITLALALAPLTAAAQDWARITERDAFLGRIGGQRLTHLLYDISVEVTPGGAIVGDAMGWSVSGDWTWEDGWFCRSLYWGEDDMGYNCQMVEGRGDELRFTSDRGTGRSASLRLRP